MKALRRAAWIVVLGVLSACGTGGDGGPTGSGQAAIAGFGDSPDQPVGDAYTAPAGVTIDNPLQGDLVDCATLQTGTGGVVKGCTNLHNTAATAQDVGFPCGTILIARSPDAQNGLIVQDSSVTVGAGATAQVQLNAFCINQNRHASQQGDLYDLGPISREPKVVELCGLLQGKDLSGQDANTTVQLAVWDISDGDGLTQDDRAKLAALPAR